MQAAVAEEARLQGNELFREKKWAAAEWAYSESLAASPTAATGSNLTATLLKLEKYAEAAASADAALGLPATPAVRAKLHYRRGLALSGAGRSGAGRAFTASARAHHMKEVSAAALSDDVATAAECDLTAVPCVRKLSDEYFDRIARVGNTSALHACRSRSAQAYNDTVFAAGKAGGSGSATSVSCLFAGVGDFRNVMATMVELHSGGGVSTMEEGDLPEVVRQKALNGPAFKMTLEVTMNDLCIATLARNVQPPTT